MNVVRGNIEEILSRPEPVASNTHSPAQLAEFGVRIADRLHARDWARQLASGLLAQARDKEPFRIEEGRTESANMSLLDPEWRRKVRRTSLKLGADTYAVLLVMRIALKDERIRLASEVALEDG
ncbi:MAG: hypothetical protein F4Y47_04470 [Acidobacteriia bacterium]|nr:hypothetical protein [Terriglobia bacterium]MYG04262.1 hypothetical protein [Terriglobia bacterium]MYK11410.1 hypothetical protein [Terriglobia bacterium]